MGEHEQKIIQQALRLRRPLPDEIKDAPELQFGLEIYWDAFWDLSTCRPSSFSVGAIPWSSIRDYGQTFEFDESQMETLFYVIRLMDNEFVKFHTPKKGK